MYESIITVRTSSSRLPSKCLMKFGNSDSVLRHIINRAKNYGLKPIICTSTDASDDVIEEISKSESVPFFRGSLENKMKRWNDCANYYNLTHFHTIDADDPFFDGNRMLESLNLLQQGQFDYIKPSNYSDSGAATEGYSIKVDFLSKVVERYSDDCLDTEMAIFYFESFDTARFRIMENPSYQININGCVPRLTLDFLEDYIFLNAIAFLTTSNVARDKIEAFISANPMLVNINISLNKLWKQNQLSKKKSL